MLLFAEQPLRLPKSKVRSLYRTQYGSGATRTWTFTGHSVEYAKAYMSAYVAAATTDPQEAHPMSRDSTPSPYRIDSHQQA